MQRKATASDAARMLGISHTTFVKYAKMLGMTPTLVGRWYFTREDIQRVAAFIAEKRQTAGRT